MAAAQVLIDVHHHVILPEYERALVRSGTSEAYARSNKNSEPQAMLDSFGRQGIAGAIINPLSASGVHHGDDEKAAYLTRSVNEALARFISTAPETFGFFAPLPFPDIDSSLRQMEYALDTLGADGVILLSSQNDVYVGAPEGEALWAEMNRRGVTCLVHPGRSAYVDQLKVNLWPSLLEFPIDTTRVAVNLIYHGVMQRYPNIKWILAHAGGCLPFLSYRLQLMMERDLVAPPFSQRVPEGPAPYIAQFYYDTALAGSPAALAALNAVANPHRVFYGSDSPFIDGHMLAEQLEVLRDPRHSPGGSFDLVEHANATAHFPRFAKT